MSKTKVVVLTKKRIPTIFPLRIGDVIVETKPMARYLGVLIDSKLNYFEQIRRTADKATKSVSALPTLMTNIGRPKPSKRRLLMMAIHSVHLYGAEVWANALDKEMYRKRLSQAQRRGALRMASAFRMVSEPAVLLVAGVISIDLLAKQR